MIKSYKLAFRTNVPQLQYDVISNAAIFVGLAIAWLWAVIDMEYFCFGITVMTQKDLVRAVPQTSL